MFITYTRNLDKVTLSHKDLEGVAFHYSLTGSEYCLNLLSNLTYVGKADAGMYDTWNTIVTAMTGTPIEHSTSQTF